MRRCHRQDVIGVLSGFDRMRFRGTLRSISYAEGVDRFLGAAGVRYKDFKEFALGLSRRLIQHAEQVAKRAGRPFEYEASSGQDKQALAEQIAVRDGITERLVCILRCVEPCMSFSIRRNGAGGLGFRYEQRKCLHSYYYLDREFGLMHVRVATRLPFSIQVCSNGREYLGSVLRVETTINNARRFKVRKMTVRKGIRGMRWIPMRHAVADLDRRVEISRAANERYLEALAVVEEPSPARALLDAVSRPVTRNKRSYRALRPVSRSEVGFFEAVLGGQFMLKGFTNRNLRERLGMCRPVDVSQRRRQSARITRLLRLLRAHGLIRKVSGTRYYRVTPKGQRIMTAALKLRAADVAKLVA